ncbi:MAG: hypothetical protein JNM11_03775, partial [Chitinimonas sp.]|nr:hypothetical protein [Chitinimonas sp.]
WTHTAGCVGILKDWLNRAVESGVRQGLDTIDAAFVCQFKPDSRFIQVVLEDALEGEKRLAEVSSNRIQEIIVAQASAPKKAAEPINLDAFFSPPRQARRVGERNPSRDPVGGGRQLMGA